MTVQPTLQDVARATEAFAAQLPARLAGRAGDAVQIALAEVLTNIVQHGLRGRAPAPIELDWQERDDRLEVEVRDAGDPIPAARLAAAGEATFAFDPDDLSALPEGGLGLAILKTAFDVVDYRSGAGINVLHLEKRLA
jgi:serine/threonine-protein kinase RsbW